MTTPGKKLTRRCHSILFKINPYLCRNQSGNQNQYQQSQDGIQFREHGQYHRSTEHVITATDCHDTVSTYLSLTDSREESYQAKSQSGTEDGRSRTPTHIHVRQETTQQEISHETIQSLRRR